MAFVLEVALATEAAAQYGHDFAPHQCVSCGAGWQEVDWIYQAGGGPGSELPLDPNGLGCSTSGCAAYINSLAERRYFLGNEYVSRYGVRVGSFNTEFGWDFLTIGTETTPNHTLLTGSADPPLNGLPAWVDVQANPSLQVDPGRLEFQSDSSVTQSGFLLDRARVCCSADAVPGDFLLAEHRRHTGALLATNDVVYLRVQQEPGEENAIAIWPMQGVTADFDLYAKCGQRPSYQNADLVSTSGGSKEFIRLEEAGCPPGGVWFVAVHSYAGQGGFNLARFRRLANAPHRTLRAGTGFTMSPAQLQLVRQLLQDAAGAIFGATEGLVWIDRIDLFNSGNCLWCEGPFGFCDICFIQSGDRSNYNGIRTFITNDAWGHLPGGQVAVYGPKIIAHEWGHQYIGAHDEYVEGGSFPVQCGHSLMATPYRWDQNNMCSSLDHERDADTGAPPSGNHTSVWARMAGPWFPNAVQPTYTPDNYSFLGSGLSPMTGAVVEDFFNFNGKVAVVVQR